MTDYASEEHMTYAAQTCRSFASRKQAPGNNNSGRDISCEICRNWSGASCIKNNFDNAIDGLYFE